MVQTEALQFGGAEFVSDDKFLRRIPPWHLKPTGEISSAAFQNDKGTNNFSTNWKKLSSVEDTINNYPDFGVASVSAKLCWELRQKIVWAPLDNNVAHCEIAGRKTESISKKFRNGAEFLVFPRKLE